MFALSVLVIVCLVNTLALVLYRAYTVSNRLEDGRASYSRDLFSLRPEGVTVWLFGYFLVSVHPYRFWNAFTFLLFPAEFSVQETSVLIRFTDWFAKHESAWSDLTYVALATILFPFKVLGNVIIIGFMGLLALCLD